MMILCAVPLLTGLYAQEQPTDWRQTMMRNEFSLAIGDPIMSNIVREAYSSTWNGDGPSSWLAVPTRTQVYTSLPITLGYRFRLLKWLWLGGDISYCGYFGTSKDIYS